MGSVLLIIHLVVAIFLVMFILMQRNSGNALSGLGGGNGADNFLSARGKGNLLTRVTSILAVIFFITSILLSLYYKGQSSSSDSIVDVAPLVQTEPNMPTVPTADNVIVEDVVDVKTIEQNIPETPEVPVQD